MQQFTAVSDTTLDQIRVLTTRLTECLAEAQNIRARFTKARDANVWPVPRAGRRRRRTDRDHQIN